MNFKKIKQNNKGMTLMEVLVAISIITFMASIPFMSRTAMTNSQRLNVSSQKLVSDIRMMQSFVLNMKDYNGTFPSGGWGVVIYNTIAGKNYYELFADMDGDTVFDDDGTEIYRKIELPSEIIFSGLNDDLGGNITSDSRMIVSFQPPDPAVTLCESNNNDSCDSLLYDTVQLVLSNADVTNTRIIEINKYGLVDIKNN